jgi:hypothetical protein
VVARVVGGGMKPLSIGQFGLERPPAIVIVLNVIEIACKYRGSPQDFIE